VEFLLTFTKVDVNKQQHQGSTPFYAACQEGHQEVVSFLLADTRIDGNKPKNDGATPFYVACQNGHQEVVSLLLADMRIEVNKPQSDGATPFFVACQEGHQEVVSLLLADMRIDINNPDNAQCTPLWMASQEGHLSVVQVILVTGREVDTKTESIAGEYDWNDKTVAEMANYQGIRAKMAHESEEDYTKKKQNGPLIANLLDSFDADPAAIRQELRELPELRDTFISDLFALVVFVCDGLLIASIASSASSSSSLSSSLSSSSSVNSNSHHKAARFFQIAEALPMELQMVLSNVVFCSGKNLVLTKHSEPAFKKLGRMLCEC